MRSFTQACYLAHLLTLRNPSGSVSKLGRSVLNSTIDLTPHQIDAALFAFQNPLSKGVILADEVGLGKTIEAGIIISQLWAENKRKILCITPASIRKQWQGELKEKFYIDSVLLDSKIYNQLQQEGQEYPFEQTDKVIICSYQFARRMETALGAVPWDLVVIDEAHRLRNVYRSDNKIARSIRKSISLAGKKVLLTATPLQNSLLELYGLVSFVDDRIFGNLDSFRDRFVTRHDDRARPEDSALCEIKKRIAPVAHRTLRRQVQQYVKYTNRESQTFDFEPSDEEMELYQKVSDYLRSPESIAISCKNSPLLILVIRKILASSSFAIADTLGKLISRLKTMKEEAYPQPDIDVTGDFEGYTEMEDEWAEAGAQQNDLYSLERPKELFLSEADNSDKQIDEEINRLESYRKLAQHITENAKGKALLRGLKFAFEKAAQLGSPRKVLVFTESKRTQQYLKELLTQNGFGPKTLTLNGSNTDPESRHLLERWRASHRTDGKVTGVNSADTRAAILEEFQERAEILLATESGAEGLNMQFCNVVINYDLPWNPQRIEQRIGRCHRYGQKYDVVVINFLNSKNAADRRVMELLKEKLNLFDGVFGSSDSVLGALESGVDIEKSIGDIFQNCRTQAQIEQAFDELQTQLEDTIAKANREAKSKLFDNFDEDVSRRIKGISMDTLTVYDSYLLVFLQAALGNGFVYDKDTQTVRLDVSLPFWKPEWNGIYSLKQSLVSTRPLHLNLPALCELIAYAKSRTPKEESLTFDYTHSGKNSSMLKELLGQSGFLRVSKMTVSALDQADYLICSICTADGKQLSGEYAEKLLLLPVSAAEKTSVPDDLHRALAAQGQQTQTQIVQALSKENTVYYEQEKEKLAQWANDLEENFEKEINKARTEMRALNRAAANEMVLSKKIEIEKEAHAKEKLWRKMRFEREEKAEEILQKRNDLVEEVTRRLQSKVEETELFTIGWKEI